MKDEYFIDKVSKGEIKNLLYTYHYLKDESKDFKSGFNYALYRKSFTDVLRIGSPIAACVFTSFPVPELAVGHLDYKEMNKKVFMNSQDFVFIQMSKKKNIISHPGS